jgi:hypothetical protein
MQQRHYLVPTHREGAETDINWSVTADMIEEAEDFFVDAKNRLLNVNHWARYAGLANVSFSITDSHKHMVTRNARNADHILINTGKEDLPHDAYTVDALEYDDYPDTNVETFAIRMHPNSGLKDADGNSDNTATIVIERNMMQLSATYHARNSPICANELWHGLSNSTWLALVKGLLEYYDD